MNVVRPSAMQRVASELAKSPQAEGERPVAAERTSKTDAPETPLRYSELTPEMIAVLRIEAALEDCYPQNGTRASQTLAGYAGWTRHKGAAT